jgi:hypothetical protein
MAWEIRWRRKGAKYDEPIRETWTLHMPLARTPEEAGAMVTVLLKQHDPPVLTIVTEELLKKPEIKKVLATKPFERVNIKS